MFRGQFRHTIDPKGRVSIPARFREALAADHSDKLVIVPVNNFLEVHPFAKWEALEARVAALPQFDEDARRLRYFYLSLGQDVTLDSQGRIQVPQDYRERAGLGKDLLIVGMTNWFEVWNVERWAAHENGNREPFDELFKRLASKGV